MFVIIACRLTPFFRIREGDRVNSTSHFDTCGSTARRHLRGLRGRFGREGATGLGSSGAFLDGLLLRRQCRVWVEPEGIHRQLLATLGCGRRLGHSHRRGWRTSRRLQLSDRLYPCRGRGWFYLVRSDRHFFLLSAAGPQTCTASPQWLADAAGRLGIVWNSPVFGDLLFYGKGGAAWVRDHYTNLALPGAPSEALPGVLFSASETQSGWVAGAGIELMILPAWSVRVEYDYYGFPEKSVGFNGGSGDFFTEEIRQNMQTVTVGVNYHFGYVAPVAASYVTK